jgi:glycosyltransferase involved in cell wall biosynthesis
MSLNPSLLIDGTCLDTRHRMRGTGTYARQLINSLSRMDTPDFQVLRLVAEDARTFKIWRPERNSYRLQWFLDRLLMPLELRKSGAKIYHALDPMRTASVRSMRRITTLYDLIPYTFSRQYLEPLPNFAQEGYAWMLSMMEKSDHLIAISEFSKTEFVRLRSYNPNRISAIPLGYDPELFNCSEDFSKATAFRNEHGSFFLYSGALQPHKNMPVLLKAMTLLPKTINLVITGDSTPQLRQALFDEAGKLGIRSQVRHLGFIPAESLPHLFRAAVAFVFPSLLEGFGLPLLDAMACGTLAISSNAASLPEVGGDAPLYFDPNDPDALAECLRQSLDDQVLRIQQIARGKQRVEQFTWERTARATIEVYKKQLAQQ